jgi:prepilin-type N-terminal cleavage/methylation domain-containing protein
MKETSETMKTRVRARRRGGFTLIETIVTVGLIAVIAAFVIPTVIQKAGSGDPVKVQNDLNTVRTALETFATDVKNGFPRQISVLTSKPTVADRFIDSTTFASNQVTAWTGPYLGATISSVARDSLATGYTAYIMNFLERYDAISNTPEHDDVTGAVNAGFVATNTVYASIRVHGLTAAQAKALNTLFDGQSDPNTGTGANLTGRFRFTAPSGGVVVAYYLASPII